MTPFLAIVMSVIMLFNSVIITSLKYEVSKYKADSVLKSSIYSVLSDYDYELKNKYGLYAVSGDLTDYRGNLSGYIDDNLGYSKNFLDISVNSTSVKTYGFDHLSVLKEQIIYYSKYRAPLNLIEEFLNRAKGLFEVLNVKIPEAVITGEVGEELPKTEITIGEEEGEEYKKYDKREDAGNILSSLFGVSDDSIEIEDVVFRNLPSKLMLSEEYDEWSYKLIGIIDNFIETDINSGAKENFDKCIDDLFYNDEFTFESLYEEFVVNEYILSMFNSKTNTIRESYLNNEIEYIIFGDRNDEANEKYFCAVLMLVRYLLNTIYIYTNDEICTVADITAYVLTAVAAFKGQPFMKQVLLLSWSLIESWEDYQLLSKGKGVAIYKSSETWKTWVNYDEAARGYISFTYKDYLRLFLMLVPQNIKLARVLDLIQLNISQSRRSFNILDTVSKIEVECEMIFDKKKKLPIVSEGCYEY